MNEPGPPFSPGFVTPVRFLTHTPVQRSFTLRTMFDKEYKTVNGWVDVGTSTNGFLLYPHGLMKWGMVGPCGLDVLHFTHGRVAWSHGLGHNVTLDVGNLFAGVWQNPHTLTIYGRIMRIVDIENVSGPPSEYPKPTSRNRIGFAMMVEDAKELKPLLEPTKEKK